MGDEPKSAGRGWRLGGAVLLLGLAAVGCSKSGKRPAASGVQQLPASTTPPSPAASTPPAPTPSASAAPGAPGAPPEPGSTTGVYCLSGGEPGGPSACADQHSRHANWHLHSWVLGPDGLCYQCWDEESSDCETAMPNQHPFKPLGSEDPGSCGRYPFAPAGPPIK